jgi:Tfp pilus assembly protein PilF
MPNNTQFYGQAERAKHYFSPLLLIALATFSLPGWAVPHTGGTLFSCSGNQGRGGGNTLFGDFKVDDSNVSGPKPEIFTVILYTEATTLIARDTVSNHGRYRFVNVPNGQYYIVVEVEGREVVRINLVISEPQRTDIRRDIELEWRGALMAGDPKKGSAIVAAGYDHRTPANQALFDKTLEAIKRNDAKQAIAWLNQIVSADAQDFEAWTELGTLYFKQDKLSEAEKAYLRALTERPSFLLALLNLGKLRLSQKNFEGAIESLSRVVEMDPQSADANLYLGEAYLQIKKGSKAVGYFNEAIRLDPVGKAEAHLRLAALYRAAGLKDKAVAEYEQFLAKKPDSPEKKMIQQYITENKKQ